MHVVFSIAAIIVLLLLSSILECGANEVRFLPKQSLPKGSFRKSPPYRIVNNPRIFTAIEGPRKIELYLDESDSKKDPSTAILEIDANGNAKLLSSSTGEDLKKTLVSDAERMWGKPTIAASRMKFSLRTKVRNIVNLYGVLKQGEQYFLRFDIYVEGVGWAFCRNL